MSEDPRSQQPEGDVPEIDDPAEGQGEAPGRRAADVTPPIDGGGQADQTSSPAAEDDVGVPPDEEMEREA
jgi:hypothetical protein